MADEHGQTDELHPFGAGSHAPLENAREMPGCYPIKGNIREDGTRLYHRPDSRNYGATVPEIWFDSPSAAETAGFELSPTHPRGSTGAEYEPGRSGHPCTVEQVMANRNAAPGGAIGGAGILTGVPAVDPERHPYGVGSHVPLDDAREMPQCYPIKGNVRDDGTLLYHRPDSRNYGATIPEVWFDAPSTAESAGFELSPTHPRGSTGDEYEPGRSGHPCTVDDVNRTRAEVGGFDLSPLAGAAAGAAVLGAEAVDMTLHPYGIGSRALLDDPDEMPACYPIKGNIRPDGSRLYHRPDSRNYGATGAEVWFDSPSAAEAAGFVLAPTHPRRGNAADFEPGGSGHPCTVDEVDRDRSVSAGLAAAGLGLVGAAAGAGDGGETDGDEGDADDGRSGRGRVAAAGAAGAAAAAAGVAALRGDDDDEGDVDEGEGAGSAGGRSGGAAAATTGAAAVGSADDVAGPSGDPLAEAAERASDAVDGATAAGGASEDAGDDADGGGLGTAAAGAAAGAAGATALGLSGSADDAGDAVSGAAGAAAGALSGAADTAGDAVAGAVGDAASEAAETARIGVNPLAGVGASDADAVGAGADAAGDGEDGGVGLGGAAAGAAAAGAAGLAAAAAGGAEAGDAVSGVAGEAGDAVSGVAGEAGDAVSGAAGRAGSATSGATERVGAAASGAAGRASGAAGAVGGAAAGAAGSARGLANRGRGGDDVDEGAEAGGFGLGRWLWMALAALALILILGWLLSRCGDDDESTAADGDGTEEVDPAAPGADDEDQDADTGTDDAGSDDEEDASETTGSDGSGDLREAALAALVAAGLSGIDVEVDGDVVRLVGEVGSDQDVAAAETAINSLAGVGSLSNDLTVADASSDDAESAQDDDADGDDAAQDDDADDSGGDADTTSGDGSDTAEDGADELRQAALAALATAGLDDVDVEVDGDVVRLVGEVGSDDDLAAAEAAVAEVAGVGTVSNDLTVVAETPPADATDADPDFTG